MNPQREKIIDRARKLAIPLNPTAYAKGQEAGSRVDLGQRAKVNGPTLRIAS